MQHKPMILTFAGIFLALASASYAADMPADAQPPVVSDPGKVPADPQLPVVSDPRKVPANAQLPVVTDPGKVYLIKDNPFYWRHVENAIGHAREAEIAGNMGKLTELRAHAQMSLLQAQEAQRAGNVAGMNEGIANLRKALETQASPKAASSAEGVDPQCIDELQRQCGDVEPGSGRIQKCFDDKISNFSSMCQEKLKEGKAAIALALSGNRHEKEVGNAREEAALRSSTDFVREARKNLSEAAGKKYVEIQPQKAAVAVN